MSDIIVLHIIKVIQYLDVAKMFGSKIRYLPKRPGERYASALTNMNLTNKSL